jgi:hypothetical protein
VQGGSMLRASANLHFSEATAEMALRHPALFQSVRSKAASIPD